MQEALILPIRDYVNLNGSSAQCKGFCTAPTGGILCEQRDTCRPLGMALFERLVSAILTIWLAATLAFFALRILPETRSLHSLPKVGRVRRLSVSVGTSWAGRSHSGTIWPLRGRADTR
jgi:hypothetical protein